MSNHIHTLILSGALAVTAVGAERITTASGPAPALPVAHVIAAARPSLPHIDARGAAIGTAVKHRVRDSAPAAKRAVRRTRTPLSVAHVAPTPVTWPGPTTWSELNRAITRIPGTGAERARWIVSERYGHWGTADWYDDTIYISPRVAKAMLYAVAVHEWSHLLSVRPYPDVATATAAMNNVFGGSGLTGAERAADCMAILQGARWTHYTSCPSQAWRSAAALLLDGRAA